MASQPGARGEELPTPPESKRFQLPCWRRGVKSYRHLGGIRLRSLQEGGVFRHQFTAPLSPHSGCIFASCCSVQVLGRATLTQLLHPPFVHLPGQSLMPVLFPAPAECQHPPGAAAEWGGRHSHKTAKKQLGSPLGTIKWGKIFFHRFFQSYVSESNTFSGQVFYGETLHFDELN